MPGVIIFIISMVWKDVNYDKYQWHIMVGNNKIDDEKAVKINDSEKRKEAYGSCGECNEPGTGWKWCKSCNAKRFEKNFENWTSGNKDIDEFIRQSQLNAVHYEKCLEWIPFENFQNVTYIAKGGFGKIYSAEWPEGYIRYWDIENKEWVRYGKNDKVALKSLDNSSHNISTDFLNEIKSHLQIYLLNVIYCYGITQNPNSKDYMMVLEYCSSGDLRNYLRRTNTFIDYESKIINLTQIAKGLLDIHNAGKVHKDFHSGNILIKHSKLFISDLGMCQPANNNEKSKGIYGVLPYMAPEVLRGRPYTEASDVYSFGIIINELLSEETPYNNIPHDHILAVRICRGLRPKISEDTPKLLADLIMKCWDANAKNRPTSKKLYDTFKEWDCELEEMDSDIYFQIQECEKRIENKLKNKNNNLNENNRSKDFQTHPQAIYTSRLLSFKNLPEPVNSTDLSSFQFNSDDSISISECLDCVINIE